MFSFYLKSLLYLTVSILGSIIVLNYFADPAGIYRPSSVSPDTYASRLVKSKNGLLWPEGMFAERYLAKALSKLHQNADCIVVGSSRVMQVSSAREHRSLNKICSSILNLSVSGAGIEDHITLSYFVVKAGFRGRIVLGIAPWTFTFGRDPRWNKYKDDYQLAKDIIYNENKNLEQTPIQTLSLLSNLLNFEHSVRSFAVLTRFFAHGPLAIEEAPSFQHKIGLSDPVKLPDASHVYSYHYMKKMVQNVITLEQATSHEYKVNQPVSPREGIHSYKKLIEWISASGATPIMLLIPYHPMAWSKDGTAIHAAMVKTEKIAHQMAKLTNTQLYGSYNPNIIGCNIDEFFDVMHAKDVCLQKINYPK